jgi:hypothetical protein
MLGELAAALLTSRSDEVYPVDGLLDMGAPVADRQAAGHAELRDQPLVGVTHPRLLRHRASART